MKKLTVQQMIDWLLSVKNPNAELVIHQMYGIDDCIEFNSFLYDIYIEDGTDYNKDDGLPREDVIDKVAICMYR